MDNKRQLDDLFKQQQQRHERAPSEQVWTRLEQRLEQRKPRRKPLSVWWQALTVAAVLLLLMLPIAYYITIWDYDKKNGEMAQIDANKAATPSNIIIDSTLQEPVAHNNTAVADAVDRVGEQPSNNENSPIAPPPSKRNTTEQPIAQNNSTSSKDMPNSKAVAAKPSTASPKPTVTSSPTMESSKLDNSQADATIAETTTSYSVDMSKDQAQKSRGSATPTSISAQKGRSASATSSPTPARSVITLAFTPGEAVDYIGRLQQMVNNSPVQVATVPNYRLTTDEMAALVPLLNSTEPAAAVYRAGETPPKAGITSTVGNEAYWLIKSFKDRSSYPPKLSVKVDNKGKVTLYNTPSQISLLQDWWKKH
jgi:hypothetical protein